jgi:hypothetical protein
MAVKNSIFKTPAPRTAIKITIMKRKNIVMMSERNKTEIPIF